MSNAAVAAKLRTTGFTVGLWRNRFIAEGIAGLGDEPRPGAPREIGDEKVEQVVRLIEQIFGKSAIRELLPMQPGDVPETYADVSALCKAVGFRPDTSIVEGIASFVEWFRGFAYT